jgi:hypothetical protein
MQVTHLLQLESLGLELRWGEDALVSRDISGVTVTDLEDPARFVELGDLVLTGLVWWTPKRGRVKADRFVRALRQAGAAALLAGEETHGSVPDAVVDACREHGVALVAVPARTSFRAITDAVYLRQWGSLGHDASTGRALSEATRRELDRLLADHAPLAGLLDQACGPLDLPCQVVSATGRVLAGVGSIPNARDLRVDGGSSPYDSWRLRVPADTGVPPRALQEIVEVVTRHHQQVPEGRAVADRLVADIESDVVTASALNACGLPETGPYLVATLGHAGALDEALSRLSRCRFAVGTLPHGEAVAVLHPESCAEARNELAAVWPLVVACAPDRQLHGGLSSPATDLRAALDQARHAAAAAAHGASRIAAIEDLTTLGDLLTGLPPAVRAVYRSQVLGSLPPVLLETLEVFLAHNGSWARAAETLHVHVNTVHYRIERVEKLTGRDLASLDHRLDLRAALLCR